MSGGEHAHVIAGNAVHSGPGEARAAKDVAAADDDAELDSEARDLGDLAGDPRQHLRLDAVVTGAKERLAAELQENSAKGRCGARHDCLPSPLFKKNPAQAGLFVSRVTMRRCRGGCHGRMRRPAAPRQA